MPCLLNFLDFITRTILGEEYRSLSSSLRSFLHSLPCPLGPNILLNTIFSNTLSLGSSLYVSDQVSNPYKTTGKNYNSVYLNPLSAELNPVCQLLVLLGDLTFMGPCIVSIFQYTCIYNKMQRYTFYLYLETALLVSGGTSTHHQERIQLYLQHLLFVTPLLLSAAIVEELEPV
jgi:hypothetical protein